MFETDFSYQPPFGDTKPDTKSPGQTQLSRSSCITELQAPEEVIGGSSETKAESTAPGRTNGPAWFHARASREAFLLHRRLNKEAQNLGPTVCLRECRTFWRTPNHQLGPFSQSRRWNVIEGYRMPNSIVG